MKRTIVMILAAIVLCAGLGRAQGLGKFVGTVTDPSGAAVPAARVTATEVRTGLSRTATTGQEGYFVIPALRPTDYRLSAEASGFRTFSQTGITLSADQTVTLNPRLELGPTAESVEVLANAIQVDTATPTLRQVIDKTRIVELPLNGRNAAQLTLLVAGSVNVTSGMDQGPTKTFPGAVTISTNGAREAQINYQLDGGNNVDEYTNVNQPFPFPDAVQEFSVQTSNYSAEYGQNAGAVVNIVTKSGANELHGDAFGFLRNAVLNARNNFAPLRDQLKRAQFGGTAGGPLTIPKLYSGRDHTFFFLGYQGTQIRNVGNTLSAFVPTAENVNGDFSALLDANSPKNPLQRVVQVVDPQTRQPFQGNRIPVSRFDPASLALLKYLPTAGGNGSTFFLWPLVQGFNEVVGKLDHSIGTADRLTGRYYGAHFSNDAVFNPRNILSYRDGSTIFSQNYLLSETHVFRPNLLNEFRFCYSREVSDRGPAPGVPNVRDLGVNLYQPAAKTIQSINVTGFFSFGDNPPARFTRNNFTWSDNLRWVRGKHSLIFGGSLERSRFDQDNLFLQPGTFEFSSDVTNYAVASFLLGRLRNFRQGAGQFLNNRANFIGVYAQDSFRAGKRLTLNYGLRWEPFFPWNEIKGRVEQFRPDAYQRGEKSQVYVNAPPGLFFRGDPGVPDAGIRPSLANFAPRVGFAYDLSGNGRTSLRGGAGVFYNSRTGGYINTAIVALTPYSPQIAITDPPGPFSDPLLGGPSPFPAPFPPPRDAPFPRPVLVVTYDPAGNPPGKTGLMTMYNWNLALERQLGGDWLLRLAYVGSHGSHVLISGGRELNPAVYTPGSSLSTDQRRIFQGIQSAAQIPWSGNSSYNSMQVSIEKRLSSSLTILTNYTFSRSLDDLPANAFVLPWYFPRSLAYERGPSVFDRAHRLVNSYVWQLPQPGVTSRIIRRLSGDWQLSGILTLQSGGPLTVVAGRDQSQTGLGGDRATMTGLAKGAGACKNLAPCVDFLSPGSFALPPVGTFGTLGKGTFRGPGYFNWDMGLVKNLRLTERWRLQFRGEFFNIFNHVNLNDPIANVSAGGFGSIRAASDPRIGQLALKILF